MKAKYIIIIIAFACVLCACNREEASLFETSAAERAQAALDNAMDILTAPENGWEMLYFANPESCGYNILVKFDKHGRVDATAKNTLTTFNKMISDSSTWVLMNDYGPILSFDTYNKVLHAWADPRNDGDGYLGDYEFLILKAEPNYIKLKSKKHSAYCYLYPLKTGITDAQYFQEIEDMQAKLFKNDNLLHFKDNNGEFLLHDGIDGIFSLSALNAQPDEEEPDIFPFATRQNGIQLMVAVRGEDTSYEFKNNMLVGASSKIFAAQPVSYFTEYILVNNGTWKIDITEINDATKDAIAVVDAALKAAYTKNKKKASVQGIRFKKSGDNITVIMSYIGNSTKANDVNFNYEIKVQGNALKLAYQKPADDASVNVVNAFPSVIDLMKTLDGTYALNTKNLINPSFDIKLTENSNSALWFNLTGSIE